MKWFSSVYESVVVRTAALYLNAGLILRTFPSTAVVQGGCLRILARSCSVLDPRATRGRAGAPI